MSAEQFSIGAMACGGRFWVTATEGSESGTYREGGTQGDLEQREIAQRGCERSQLCHDIKLGFQLRVKRATEVQNPETWDRGLYF